MPHARAWECRIPSGSGHCPLISFLVALQFLTRLPSPIRREITLEQLGASVGWFPLVGAVVGLLLVTVDVLARPLLHAAVVDALLVATLVMVSGALHLDGLIDTVDGLSAGPDRATQLASMREAHASPVGAFAGCAALLATYAAIAGLPAGLRGVGLFLAPVAGRTAILLAYHSYPYARPDLGFSRALKDGATGMRTALGVASAAAVAGAVSSIGGLAILALALSWMHLAAFVSTRRLGGITGDVQGAICESSQLLVLLAAPALQRL